MKIVVFWWKFIEICSPETDLEYSSIGSDNVLTPPRRRAIFWTNDG